MTYRLLAATAMAVLLFGAVAVPSLRWNYQSGNAATASLYHGGEAGLRSPPGSTASASGELRITIRGIRSATGTVLVGLYDSRASFTRAIELAGEVGFLNDPDRIAGAALKANRMLTSAAVFANLAPGRYAVILFHDENGNGKLDKNVWGVPLEPYGFSNNAQGFLGPPSFEDAMIKIEPGTQEIDITLVYHELEGEAAVAHSQAAAVP